MGEKNLWKSEIGQKEASSQREGGKAKFDASGIELKLSGLSGGANAIFFVDKSRGRIVLDANFDLAVGPCPSCAP